MTRNSKIAGSDEGHGAEGRPGQAAAGGAGGAGAGERVARSRAPRRWSSTWSSRKTRRRAGYRLGLFLGLCSLSIFSVLPDGRVLAKGPANPGHEALSCRDCHDPAPGTFRQQVQAAVAYGLGGREEAPDFGRLPVSNKVCLECHEREDDRHPTHVFMQPKYAEAREEIGAHLCFSCHAEHSGRHVVNTGQFCFACHENLTEEGHEIEPDHAVLVQEERWDTCLQCHDFHGNHERRVPRTFEEALTVETVQRHLEAGASLYGEKRRLTPNERPR